MFEEARCMQICWTCGQENDWNTLKEVFGFIKLSQGVAGTGPTSA